MCPHLRVLTLKMSRWHLSFRPCSSPSTEECFLAKSIHPLNPKCLTSFGWLCNPRGPWHVSGATVLYKVYLVWPYLCPRYSACTAAIFLPLVSWLLSNVSKWLRQHWGLFNCSTCFLWSEILSFILQSQHHRLL